MANTNHTKHFLLITLALLIVSCSKNELPYIPESGTILAFGDSLTAGMGVSQTNSYPAILAELSNRHVVNAGISGEVTANGLIRLTELLDESNPSLLILLEGGNDILRNHNLSKTKQNLAAMIRMAKGRNIPVLLIGVPKRNLFSKSAAFYKELAEEHQLIYMNELISTLLKSPGYKSDQIHFNEKGYRTMAEKIHQVLKDHGAL